MSQDWQRQTLSEARIARLATVSTTGEPYIVPCVFTLLDDAIYSAIDEKPKSGRRLRRLKNIEATDRAALLVDHYEEDWSQLAFVMVRGRAEIIGPDDPRHAPAIAALGKKYPQYQQMSLDAAEVIVIQIEHQTGWRASKSAP